METVMTGLNGLLLFKKKIHKNKAQLLSCIMSHFH